MSHAEIQALRWGIRIAMRGVLCLLIGLPCASRLRAQTPEEHASHHPDGNSATTMATGPAATGAKPNTMSGMGGSSAGPATTPTNSSGMGGKLEQPGGMGGMGGMMKEMMGGPQQKEFYPSLMALPTTTSEQRLQLQQQAEARAQLGAALLQRASARIADPAANDLERQEAAADARAGLQELESGQAAQRALADGRAPRDVALQWFQREMNLASPARPEEHALGVTMFHLFTMVLLIAFALAMVAMYFFKMRRAAALFGRIEGDSGARLPGSAPPLGGTPGPSQDVPPTGPSAASVPGGEGANAG